MAKITAQQVAELFQSRTSSPGHSDAFRRGQPATAQAVSIPNGHPRPFRHYHEGIQEAEGDKFQSRTGIPSHSDRLCWVHHTPKLENVSIPNGLPRPIRHRWPLPPRPRGQDHRLYPTVVLAAIFVCGFLPRRARNARCRRATGDSSSSLLRRRPGEASITRSRTSL